MKNSETLATLGTQVTGRRQTKQNNHKSTTYNVYLFCPTKQTDATFGVIVHLPEPMSIPRGSIDELLFELCNSGHTRHRAKTNKAN
jgi:hypothetical protein